MRSYFAIPALGTVLLVAACEARQTTPVAMTQPGDADLTCVQVAAEIKENEAKAIELAGADMDLVSNNVAAGVVGTLVWPMFLATDLSQSEQIQFRALRDRNANLERIYRDQECPPSG